MNIDSALGRLAIVVPVAHIVACSLFLFGYNLGFGDNVGTLFSPNDFFVTSLVHLASMYVIGLGLPSMFIVYRHRTGKRSYLLNEIENEKDPARRVKLLAAARRDRAVIIATVGFFALVGAARLILDAVYDVERQYVLNMLFITLFGSLIFWRICEQIKFEGVASDLTMIVIFFAVSVTASGMNEGFRDRRSAYADAAANGFACSRYAVVSSAGDKYLAASVDGQRHLITSECKALFSFQIDPPLKEGSSLRIAANESWAYLTSAFRRNP